MLAYTHRKVNQTGGLGSIVLRPPKEWARLAHVGPGDEVVVAFGHGTILFVAPSERRAEIERIVAAAGVEP